MQPPVPRVTQQGTARGPHLRLKRHRHSDVWRPFYFQRAEKFRPCDADDGECGAVQRDGLSNDRWIAAKSALPIAMADHRCGCGVCLVVFVGESAPQECGHAKPSMVTAAKGLPFGDLR